MNVNQPERPQRAGSVKLSAEELYRRCSVGDEEAWRYLFSWCVKVARGMNWVEAEDMAQEVCIRLMDGGLGRVKEPGKFLAFVRRALNNFFIDHYRKYSRLESLDRPLSRQEGEGASRLELTPSPQTSPVLQAEARVLLCRLEVLLEQLSDYCPRVMRAYIEYRLGLIQGYKDIASLLGIPLGTVSVRIRRCLAELRRYPEFSDLGPAAKEHGR